VKPLGVIVNILGTLSCDTILVYLFLKQIKSKFFTYF